MSLSPPGETRRSSPAILAAGDATAILLFAVIGLVNHDEGITAAGLARNVLPILGAWGILAPVLGTYRRPGFPTMLATWALAVPIGVAIRAIVLHREADDSQVTFAAVTLAVTLVLLLAWRGLHAVVSRMGRSKHAGTEPDAGRRRTR